MFIFIVRTPFVHPIRKDKSGFPVVVDVDVDVVVVVVVVVDVVDVVDAQLWDKFNKANCNLCFNIVSDISNF